MGIPRGSVVSTCLYMNTSRQMARKKIWRDWCDRSLSLEETVPHNDKDLIFSCDLNLIFLIEFVAITIISGKHPEGRR